MSGRVTAELVAPDSIESHPAIDPHDLVDRVLDRLSSSGYLALQDLFCEYEQGRLRLSGRVSSHYLKQIAQEVVVSVPGVGEIENAIQVKRRAPLESSSEVPIPDLLLPFEIPTPRPLSPSPTGARRTADAPKPDVPPTPPLSELDTEDLTAMLVLTRKRDQKIFIGQDIRVTILGIQNNQVRLGIEAPHSVTILRDELVAHPATTSTSTSAVGSSDDHATDTEPSSSESLVLTLNLCGVGPLDN